MANEITAYLSLDVANGYLSFPFSTGQLQFDQTTARAGNPGTVNIGTSQEDIALGDLVNPGYVFIQNLDTTNYVQVGPKSAGVMVNAIRLYPRQFAFFPLDSAVTLRAVANTAAVNILVLALDR
jgi:hypothetical protein